MEEWSWHNYHRQETLAVECLIAICQSLGTCTNNRIPVGVPHVKTDTSTQGLLD